MNINVLENKVIELINVVNKDEIIYFYADGVEYKMCHEQECCESVIIDDINGDLNDLIGSPITMAEEVMDSGNEESEELGESETWTFYKFATVNGYVTIKWYGSSNGYYSESVDFGVSEDNYFKKERMTILRNKI